jgi:hypothetical protein
VRPWLCFPLLHRCGVHLFDVTVTNIAGENIAGERVEGEYRIISGHHVNALRVAAPFALHGNGQKYPELEPLWERPVAGWRTIPVTPKIQLFRCPDIWNVLVADRGSGLGSQTPQRLRHRFRLPDSLTSTSPARKIGQLERHAPFQ